MGKIQVMLGDIRKQKGIIDLGIRYENFIRGFGDPQEQSEAQKILSLAQNSADSLGYEDLTRLFRLACGFAESESAHYWHEKMLSRNGLGITTGTLGESGVPIPELTIYFDHPKYGMSTGEATSLKASLEKRLLDAGLVKPVDNGVKLVKALIASRFRPIDTDFIVVSLRETAQGKLRSFIIMTQLAVAEFSLDRVAILPEYLTPLVSPTRFGLLLKVHSVGPQPRTLHFKAADLPPLITVDTHGMAGWSSITREPLEEILRKAPHNSEELLSSFMELQRQENRSKYRQKEIGESRLPDRDFIFVALQTPDDVVTRLARWSPMKVLLWNLLIFRLRGLRVVVKFHPKGHDKDLFWLANLLKKIRLITITKGSIHDIIPKSKAVVTVNSGVGSEALNYLKPVLLFGKADYQAATHQIFTILDLWRVSKRLQLPLARQDMIKFMGFYRFRYLVTPERPGSLRQRLEDLQIDLP